MFSAKKYYFSRPVIKYRSIFPQNTNVASFALRSSTSAAEAIPSSTRCRHRPAARPFAEADIGRERDINQRASPTDLESALTGGERRAILRRSRDIQFLFSLHTRIH